MKIDRNCVDWVCPTLFGNFWTKTMKKDLKIARLGENDTKKPKWYNFLGSQLSICTSTFPNFLQHSGHFVYFRIVAYFLFGSAKFPCDY